MGDLAQDVRYGLRMLQRRKGFACVVGLTLALAIGANTLVFSIVNLVVLRPLPFANLDTLAALWMTHPDRGDDRVAVSYPDFDEWRSQSTAFEQMAARRPRSYNLTGVEEPTRVLAAQATASLFEVWGLSMARGRAFLPEEDAPGAEPVAVLAHGFWRRRFDADPGVVGRTVRLDGVSHTIVGVLEPDIEIGGLAQISLWTPLGPEADLHSRQQRDLRVCGRLAPGVELSQAAAELRSIVARQRTDHPVTNGGWDVGMAPFRDRLMGQETPLIIALLTLSVGLVLAVACANIASLMLARGAFRGPEIAVRAALGASRRRLVRQMLTEGFVLATLGGVGGLALGWLGLRVLRSVGYAPVFQHFVIDPRVLGFCTAVSLVSSLVFGLVPALRASRADVVAALRQGGGRGPVGGPGRRGRGGLVVLQIGFACTLLVVAGLSIRSMAKLQQQDLGFDTGQLVTMRIDLPRARYPEAGHAQAFFERLERELTSASRVRRLGSASVLPGIDTASTAPLTVEDLAGDPLHGGPWAAPVTVTPGYFEALGLPLIKGRGFETDEADSPPVAIVDQALVDRYLPARDVVGKRLRLGSAESPTPWLTIVGVVGNVRRLGLDQGRPPVAHVYRPLAQRGELSMIVLARTGDAPGLIDAARATVARLDPDQVLYDAKPMAEMLHEALNSNAVMTGSLAAFALVALGLAAVGLYGSVAYTVGQRIREIGVRMALGARGIDVLRMIMAHGLGLVLVGLGLGLIGGLSMARATASLYFGVEPADTLTLAGVGGALGVVTLLASWLPARRALRVDPAEALRSD